MYFLAHIFQNISVKLGPRLEYTPILSTKSEFHTTNLFAVLEQVLHNHCPDKSVIVTGVTVYTLQ